MSDSRGVSSCSRARRELPAAVRAFMLGAGVVIALAGCTFERRAQVPDETEAPLAFDRSPAEEPTPEMRGGETAGATVRLFREAVAMGDLSMALALLHREAILLDPLVGRAAGAGTRGELLLELRRRHARGIIFEPLETTVTLHGSGAALVLTTLAMLQEGDDGIGEETGRVYETVFLLLSPEGWRIRHLHRSLLPES